MSGTGFTVDPDGLTDYVRLTRRVADDLTTIGARHVRQVRQIADDGFGKIGKETGFAAALDEFGAALRRQVKGLHANAETLARSTARTARTYRDRDDDAKATFSRQLEGN